MALVISNLLSPRRSLKRKGDSLDAACGLEEALLPALNLSDDVKGAAVTPCAGLRLDWLPVHRPTAGRAKSPRRSTPVGSPDLRFPSTLVSPSADPTQLRVREYRRTAASYTDEDDWQAAAREEYGSFAEVADWTAIKTHLSEHPEDAEALTKRLGPWNSGLSFITCDGQKCKEGRYFFVAPHYGEVPKWFRFEDHTANGDLSLGTWKQTRRPIFIRLRRQPVT